MKVIFVGAGPGDPELLTLKAARLLETCRCCIYAGSLISPQVLALIHPDAERFDSASLSLDRIIDIVRSARERGIDVVRLHSGDPSIYGAINEQMNELEKLGIEYEVVPGVSSFQASAAALKTELTAPEISQAIVLTRTSGRTPVPESQRLEVIARTRATLCLFLSVDRIGEVCRTIMPHYGKDCPAAVVYRVSWPDQKIIRGMLADIDSKVDDEGISKTAMIIIGHALARGSAVSRLYDGGFSHGFRKGRES